MHAVLVDQMLTKYGTEAKAARTGLMQISNRHLHMVLPTIE
jgi:hypothetical protein